MGSSDGIENWPFAGSYGDGGAIVGWDDTYAGEVGDANTNGDALDGLYVQTYPLVGWWDLGFETNIVVVFLSQDHGPYPAEGLEYRVYGSNTLWDHDNLSDQAILIALYLDGWRTYNAAEDLNDNGWCSDDVAGVLQLPGNNRYIMLEGWSKEPTSHLNEPEVDAVAAVVPTAATNP